MKNLQKILCLVLALLIPIILLTACSDSDTFSFSKNLDENGYYKSIKARKYVELFDYNALTVPNDAHKVADEDVQSEVEGILSGFATSKQVKDRKVADGDSVNIDYVGSIDGVEFEGGSSEGNGADVVIGETEYIDDFLQQLIGHKPGETVNVEVTFPDEYSNNPDLQGKDALFVTKINHITEYINPKLTDKFVKKNMSESYGWNTIKEMENEIYKALQEQKVQEYVNNYLVEDVVVSSVPKKLIKFQEDALVFSYENYAQENGIEVTEVLQSYAGVSTLEELLEINQENIFKTAKKILACIAVAEDMELEVSEEDITNFFIQQVGSTENYDQEVADFGMPYVKQNVICSKVINHIIDNVVLG